MTTPSKHHLPRVWVGERTNATVWASVDYSGRGWDMFPVVEFGDIFTPGHQPRPTEDPREMETIATCREVDW